MEFFQRTPAPPLDRFIESVWYCRNDATPPQLERVLPNGSAQLIVNLDEDQTRSYHGTSGEGCRRSSGTIISGLATRFQIIDTDEQRHVVGVSFRPGGTSGFFQPPAAELADADVDLELLWSRATVSLLRERLLAAPDPGSALDVMEGALTGVGIDVPIHPGIQHSLEAFRSYPARARVGVIADELGLSTKGFGVRFKAAVGVSPKLYCRLLRFQRAVSEAHATAEVDWTEVALAAGYYDQAHFIHDFRGFAGVTPTDYRARRTGFPNHLVLGAIASP